VIRAVRAVLEDEPYRSAFEFDVYGFETPEGDAARKKYPFGPDRHGWVLLAADGSVVRCRPSHWYGAAEVTEDFDEALARAAARASTPVPAAGPKEAPR
jgi:hypothetical protein